MNRQVGLEYLSVFGLPVLDYAELAARLSCDFISLNFSGAANRLPPYSPEDLRADHGLRKRLKRSVEDLGLRICLVEGFAITPEKPAAFYARDLDDAAELGASAICAVSLDKNLPNTQEQFFELAEAAASRRLLVTTELAAGVIRNIEIARQTLGAVKHPNFKLLIDTMHFFRRGSTLQDLKALPPAAIGHVQLCDAPSQPQGESYMEEALFERRGLGDGDLPLAAFMAEIAPSIPIGLEIPMRALAERGIDAYDRLRPSVAKAREWGRCGASS